MEESIRFVRIRIDKSSMQLRKSQESKMDMKGFLILQSERLNFLTPSNMIMWLEFMRYLHPEVLKERKRYLHHSLSWNMWIMIYGKFGENILFLYLR